MHSRIYDQPKQVIEINNQKSDIYHYSIEMRLINPRSPRRFELLRKNHTTHSSGEWVSAHLERRYSPGWLLVSTALRGVNSKGCPWYTDTYIRSGHWIYSILGLLSFNKHLLKQMRDPSSGTLDAISFPLLGEIPIEIEIHKCTLTKFSTICNDNSRRNELAWQYLATKS